MQGMANYGLLAKYSMASILVHCHLGKGWWDDLSLLHLASAWAAPLRRGDPVSRRFTPKAGKLLLPTGWELS